MKRTLGAGIILAAIAGVTSLMIVHTAAQTTAAAAPAPAPQIQMPRPLAGKGVLQEGGSLRINPAAVRSYLTGSASLTHGAIPGNGGCSSQSIPVTGAVIGDKVVVGAPAELLTYSLALTYA